MLLPEIKAWLVANNLVAAGFTVVEGKLPISPDAVIVLTETGGTAAEAFFNGPTIDQPGVQVLVRGAANDYSTPRLAIERIYQPALDAAGFLAGGVRYLTFDPLQSPFPREIDSNQRHVFAFNMLVQKELSPTT